MQKKLNWKKVCVALGLSSFLATSYVSSFDSKAVEKIEDAQKDEFQIEDLRVVVQTDLLGNLKYTFVTKEEPSLNTMHYLEEENAYYIPDQEIQKTYMDASKFFKMNLLDVNKTYTKEELEVLEDTYSTFLYNPYLYIKDDRFAIEDLFLVQDDFTMHLYSKKYFVTVEDNLYYYDLLDFKNGLKCTKENQIIKETSLYKKLEENNHYMVCDLSFFLNEQQKEKGYLTYGEIVDLLKTLNPEIKNVEEKMLASR